MINHAKDFCNELWEKAFDAMERLKSSLRKFYGRYGVLIMTICSDSLHRSAITLAHELEFVTELDPLPEFRDVPMEY